MGLSDYVRFESQIIRGPGLLHRAIVCRKPTMCKASSAPFFGGGRYDNLGQATSAAKPMGGEVGAFAMGDMVISLVLEKFGASRLPRIAGGRCW